jgi:hypothetical protein
MSLVYDGSTDTHAADHLSASDSFCLEMLKEEHPQVGVEDSHSYETTDSKTRSIENHTLSQQPTLSKDNEKVTEASPAPTFTVKATETNLFLTHFWEKKDGEDPPTIIESYSCTYWPRYEGAGILLPHGRMFVTSKTMFFIGWGTKKIVFNWEDVISVEKGTTALGLMDNAIDIKCREGDKEESYFFGSFASRDSAFQLISQLVSVAQSLKELSNGVSVTPQNVLGDVPPDETIKKMDLLLSKTLKGVSVSDFFTIVWSEEETAQPFYLPLLLKKGNQDVTVEKWEIASNEGFVKPWCGEKYSRRRQVNYKHVRTTHLYIGPPIATVSEVHHVRTEGQNKCVFSMTVQIGKLPCSCHKILTRSDCTFLKKSLVVSTF